MTATAHRRDVVVIGASAGGVEAIGRVLGGLPEGLAASVFVVLHMNPYWPSKLPQVFARHTRLPVGFAIHGEPIEHGRVYVAPPDNQLMLRAGYLHVVRGPKENGHRPSVDALFRTAAAAFGSRVIGVVLTGYQDCGTAGLMSIKARGGTAVVQSPEEAFAKDMPASAVEHAKVDHVVPVGEIPEVLQRLIAEPAGPTLPVGGAIAQLEGDAPGVPVELVCPLCSGAMTETTVNGYQSFRCHVGHAFSLSDVASEQAESVERAMWAASRALEESAALERRLALASMGDMKGRHEEKEQAQLANAQLIRSLILGNKN